MAIQIITTSLPSGVTGTAYSQAIQTYGGVSPLVFSKPTGALPTGLTLNTATGVISGTPTAASTFNFVIEVEDDEGATDTQSFTVNVYAPLNTSPDPLFGDSAVVVEGGSQTSFTVAGGSGTYQWSVSGGNLINPFTGLLTAIVGGPATVTVIDSVSGQTATISVIITSQSQFCIAAEQIDAPKKNAENEICCEYNVECGDRLQLRVPGFHVVEDGQRQEVIYGNLVQAVTGAASALQSKAAVAGATGNTVSFVRDAYYEIVTSYDMAQVANGDFGIGWSSNDADASIASIEHAIVWTTETAARKVQIQHFGNVEGGSTFPIAQGDAVSFGVIDGKLKLFINSVEQFVSTTSFSSCGDVQLDIGIQGVNKTIGGYVTNLSWSILTAGTSPQVGSIDANGIYTSPTNPLAGVVKVRGSLNNANFYVHVRNIQATPRTMKPQAFLQGNRAHIWVTNKRATDDEVIRIASDGSPDALQNPGMIYLGVLEASATFAEEIEYQTFDNDEGTYYQAIGSEKATLTGTFLEVRDLDKLALLMQHSTIFPVKKGVQELGVGGKGCGGCDLRVAVIVESGQCGDGWDVIYGPRVQNAGNLTLEIGKKANAKYPLTLRFLPDTTRVSGKQLYSIYQMSNCASTEGDTNSCD